MPTTESPKLNNHECQVNQPEMNEKQAPAPSKAISKVNSTKTTSPVSPANTKKNGTSPKKRPLDPQELNNMIQKKITQLETESSIEDEEEKAIGTTI